MADLLPSTAKLVAALRALPGYSVLQPDNPIMHMVARAEANYYHDFFSPLPTPAVRLMMDLQAIGASELVQRHRCGDFDATLEESDLWAQTAEGKAAMQAMVDASGKQKARPS